MQEDEANKKKESRKAWIFILITIILATLLNVYNRMNS